MKRILVVEDNEDNLYLIRFILEKNGYEVVEAKTGFKGVEVAAEEEPDLILMDIQLPDIDGYEVTRRIRATGEKVPIVALTSYAMVGDEQKALDAGCSGYLKKPIDPDNIIKDLKKFF